MIKNHLPFFSHSFFVVGNKCHLENDRVISKERGQELAEEYEILFFETSAKDDINVKKAFMALAQKALEVKLKTRKSQTKTQHIPESENSKSKLCILM